MKNLSEAKQKLINQLVIDGSSIFVKLCYMFLFLSVLLIILYFCNKALNSPWGRMMRAIRDNEVSAKAMGKNVVKRHLQVFILGSAVVGVAGAMLTTNDGLSLRKTMRKFSYENQWEFFIKKINRENQ